MDQQIIEDRKKILKDGFENTKTIYRKHWGTPLTDDEQHDTKEFLDLMYSMVYTNEFKNCRMLAINGVLAGQDIHLFSSILRSARQHPLHPMKDKPILEGIQNIDSRYWKSICYTDCDIEGKFTGFLLLVIHHFEKPFPEDVTPDQLTKSKDYSSFSVGLFPIDNDQTEFKMVGQTLFVTNPSKDNYKYYGYHLVMSFLFSDPLTMINKSLPEIC